jgi:hypothetical protein
MVSKSETSSVLASACYQDRVFRGDNRPGTKDSPQESQTISKRLASTNKKVTEVCQKVLCGIHAAKIIQSSLRKLFNDNVDEVIQVDRKSFLVAASRPRIFCTLRGAKEPEIL